ncbi:aspartate aminotransferase family protein [Paenibacillus validus]|uniref:pyridoxal phosphate-dependent decarboxylase family protein n=1 Tax=Paenibacillus validus TaxID=44253 RepID=UPI001FD1663F|nr:aspartate aminotransferase family protein [Paenibacillus validus]MED4601817.1 aspartate aminotransferase family protein [Paenibacillus validus]MED4605767.1 aspartate aminotransferase family protein [Paenibacillus validus]
MNGTFATDFLNHSEESQVLFRKHMNTALGVLIRDFASAKHPYSGALPDQLAASLRQRPVCPEQGIGMAELLDFIGEAVLKHSAVVTHPACMAHLHCPPLQASLVAEALLSAVNPSMDSWDQSMSATMLEQEVIGWLCGLFGFAGRGSDGVFTSGGTQSNFMGLLLARDHYCCMRWNWNVQQRGLPPQADRLRVLCSEEAHFTVKQSAALLGLGQQSVITVPVDSKGRMHSDLLESTIARLREDELLPFVLVATAGTTDFGSIDPLPELGEAARRHGLWLHTDAAYGGALALSDQHACLLKGIALSDSITVDFHKLFYQPISCGAFLLRDRLHYRYLRLNADYLNPEADDQAGVPNLVGKSVQTTRRFDALKLYMSLQHVGRERFAAMIDHTLKLAEETAERIRQEDALELIAEPTLNAVVFRYVPSVGAEDGAGWTDELNCRIRDRLLEGGIAVVARTKAKGKACLKFTLLNPLATLQHTAGILRHVIRIGKELECQYAAELLARKGVLSHDRGTAAGTYESFMGRGL